MTFNDFWFKAKAPDLESIRKYPFEAMRRIAMSAYKAGRKAGVEHTRKAYEKTRRTP